MRLVELPLLPSRLAQLLGLDLFVLTLHLSFGTTVLLLLLWVVRLTLSAALPHRSLRQGSIGPNISLTTGETLGYPASYT